jgi:hypothetical protein
MSEGDNHMSSTSNFPPVNGVGISGRAAEGRSNANQDGVKLEVDRVLQTCAPEVVEFCKQRSMQILLAKGIQLANKHLRPTSQVIYLSGDPDGDEEWLVIQSDVAGTVDQVLSTYDNLKTEWLRSVPDEQSSMVRFLCNIV